MSKRKLLADDYATFEAFALQCNYNLKGQVTSINPIRIAQLRFNEFDDEDEFEANVYT